MNNMESRHGFDEYANTYTAFHNIPFSRYYIEHTLKKVLSEETITDKSVLDLGCGEGGYSRMVKAMAATRVVGVDISGPMIEQARRREAEDPLGIEYVQEDVTQLRRQDRFDVVLLVLVLSLSKDRKQLKGMLQAASEHLTPGGRLIAITSLRPTNPDIREFNFRKYGLVISEIRRTECDDMVGNLHLYYRENPESELPTTKVVIFKKEAYESLLMEAGFENMEWSPVEVAPQCPPCYDEEFWKHILDNQLYYGLVCTKSSK